MAMVYEISVKDSASETIKNINKDLNDINKNFIETNMQAKSLCDSLSRVNDLSRIGANESVEAQKKKEAAIKNLADFDEKMRIDSLKGEEKKQEQLTANYEKQKAEIQTLHEAQIFATEDKFTVETEQAERLSKMKEAYQRESERISKETHEEEIKRLTEQANMVLSITESGLGSLKKLIEGRKEYATIYKASAIGEATMNAAQAVLKTMTAVPYPFNIPLAAAQAAIGAVKVQSIATAKMYRGGMIPGKNTLIMANEEGREAILNPMAVRAVGGAAGVNALNQGTYNNTYDNSRSSNNTFVIKTAVMTQKTFRDEIEPILKRAERRR